MIISWGSIQAGPDFDSCPNEQKSKLPRTPLNKPKSSPLYSPLYNPTLRSLDYSPNGLRLPGHNKGDCSEWPDMPVLLEWPSETTSCMYLLRAR